MELAFLYILGNASSASGTERSEVNTCNVGGAFLPLQCKDTCVTCRVRCWRSYSITTPSTCSWPSQRLL